MLLSVYFCNELNISITLQVSGPQYFYYIRNKIGLILIILNSENSVDVVTSCGLDDCSWSLTEAGMAIFLMVAD
jgi:hypothetical protein